jgi:L,D-peptidoglycan transpeptidase YkuD (ErfK/YbiS/YcfS/YnhG family)
MNNLWMKIILLVCVLLIRAGGIPTGPAQVGALFERINEGEIMGNGDLFEQNAALEQAAGAQALPGIGPEDTELLVSDADYSQLLLVASNGTQAEIFCYEKDESGSWSIAGELGGITGFVGRNGVCAQKREGDDCTPEGLYRVGFAFGNNDSPPTGLTYRKVTDQSFWVDDPDSLYYNQWVEGEENKDWDSAERLWESKRAYAYAAVIEYNMGADTVPGKGSAIFLHCGTLPTSGCIAVSEPDILRLLQWFSADKEPHILILSSEN